MKKFLFLSAFAAAFLASCSSDDDSNSGDGQTNGVITSLSDPDYNANSLKGNIGADIELPAGTYILDGPLVVQAPYTLTIDPGATFKATAGGTNVYLAVEQGAKLNAVGTASNPIVFTSNATTPEPGDWGGILICGYAPISGGGTAVTEVVDFFFGGTNTNDNSGSLAYVKISYSGARINGEKEFNGLTLYGVGKGTSVSNIAIYNGDDDAIEFFGGSVDVSNLLVVNAKDDMIDWTQGYVGNISNAYTIREESYTAVSSDPRGIEADGNFDGLSPTQAGQSNPTLSGITIVNNANVVMSDVFKIRRVSGANITNTLVKWGANAPAPDDFVDCTDSLGDAAAGTSITVLATGANLNLTDVKPGSNAATINVTAGTTGGADTASLNWTGYSF